VKGSQFWLQTLVNEYPDQLNKVIGAKINERDIEWLSPLTDDAYAEYRDQSFLDRLGVRLNTVPLSEFWPSLGPRWDGLARTRSGKLLLFEAKSTFRELRSPPSRAKADDSQRRIHRSLDEAKHGLGASPDGKWLPEGVYYQYANRLAFFYLLRKLNALPAHLVFLYFVNDPTVKGPATPERWMRALERIHKVLGIDTYPLSPFIHDVFFDVSTITGS
jgi:hypothetical protein